MFSSSFSRSLQLVAESFSVLRKDKEILWFTILSLIINGLIFAVFLIYFFSYMMTKLYQNELLQGDEIIFSVSIVLHFLIVFFFLDFVFILVNGFFKAGLMTCAYKRFNGEDPTFGDGFDNAKKHIEKIYLWSLMSALIKLLLKIIENISRNFSQNLTKRFILTLIGTSIIKISWSLATFFVIPVLIFEDLEIKDSIKKSWYLFKKTWGENIIGQLSMMSIFVLLFLIIMPLMFIMGITVQEHSLEYGTTTIYEASQTIKIMFSVMIILYILLLAIIFSTLNGIFVTALYYYANTGKIPSGYSPEMIKYAFAPKTS